MASVWVEGLGRSFEHGLRLLEAAVRDCPDELWEASMWEVPNARPDADLHGPDGNLVTDPAVRHALVQRFSAPWSIAWHALEVLDYDLGGDFVRWTPPEPFTGKAHWSHLTRLPAGWPQADILGYVAHVRLRVSDTLENLTDEAAARPIPATHRYRGQPYAWVLTSLPGHTIEHASQIRQFITAGGPG